ncbi:MULTISPECIES: hypothetical protein [unclassified Moorena]|nr:MULTISPECIES: hypothetical protein [unclassified Moorena]
MGSRESGVGSRESGVGSREKFLNRVNDSRESLNYFSLEIS